jgi:hypothetical protein
MEVQQIPGASSQQQQGQQAVALVLPRVEQQTSTTQTTQTQPQLIVEQSVVVASSQANSSNTVTTTQAGVKRQRDSKGDSTSRTEEKSTGPSQVSMNFNFWTEPWQAFLECVVLLISLWTPFLFVIDVPLYKPH